MTDHAGGVSNLAWSPDGQQFSFTATVRLAPTLVDQHPDLPLAEARVYDDLMVRHWDTWKDAFLEAFVDDKRACGSTRR